MIFEPFIAMESTSSRLDRFDGRNEKQEINLYT